MKKTAFHKFVCLLLVCATLLISGSVTLAWLASGTTVRDFPDDFSGSSESAYFAGGDGSPDDPYIIKNAVHLYNLAWLQYLGYFNMRSGFNNGRAQSYFRLDDNITMTGIVLPPIGTTQYPFIGSFNGNGHTVYGLTTSNLETDFDGRYPSTAEFSDANLLTYCKTGDTTDNRAIKIVGMFGVVGDYNTWITRNYMSDSDIEIKDYTETTLTNDANILYRAGMSVRGFYISYAKVKTYAAETLVGLAAGFLSAAMKNVGVYHSEIIVGNKNATGTTVQKTDGLDSTYDTKVSLYSLIGDFDSAVVDWDGTSGGTAPTWGGSIDMRTLNRRLTHMYKFGKSGYISKSEEFHTNLWATQGSSNGKYDWMTAQEGSIYLADDTFLPLNVDKTAMGLDTWDASNDDAVVYQKYKAYYDAQKCEETLESNTGYIVGDGTAAELKATIGVCIKMLLDYKPNPFVTLPGITYSFAESSLPAEIVNGVSYAEGVYNPARFAMYTMRKDSTGTLQMYRIIDDKNKDYRDKFTAVTAEELGKDDFKRYTDVRSGIDAMLEGSGTYHAIRLDSTGSSQAIKNNDGSPTYELTDDGQYIKGGINFTLNEDGYITVVLASAEHGNKCSLFDLYEVNYSGDKVSSATPIKDIYTDTSGSIYYNGVDKDGNAMPAGATEAFDLAPLQKAGALALRCVFYFEIPVRAGRYFISNAQDALDGQHHGAYIMYLDIGANGNTETPSDKPYSMEGVNYVDSDTVADPENFPEYSRVTFVLDAVANATGEYAYIIFHRDSTDGETADGVIKTKVHYKADGLTATPTGTDVSEDDTLTEPAYTGN